MRTTTYKALMEAVAHGRGALPEDLAAVDLARIAAALTRGYRYVYDQPFTRPGGGETPTMAYIDLIKGNEVAITAGKVLLSAVENGPAARFYTANPATDTLAVLLTETHADQDGFYLAGAVSTGTVYARYVAAPPPEFTHTAYDAAAVYAVGARIYFATTGQQYRCLEITTAGQSPLTHPAKWQETVLPATLQEATILYALSTYMGSEQERLQARELKAQAEALIDQLLARHTAQL